MFFAYFFFIVFFCLCWLVATLQHFTLTQHILFRNKKKIYCDNKNGDNVFTMSICSHKYFRDVSKSNFRFTQKKKNNIKHGDKFLLLLFSFLQATPHTYCLDFHSLLLFLPLQLGNFIMFSFIYRSCCGPARPSKFGAQ